jgi:predicted Rossmann fold nucleotide-binding protein DprA/Smf involved in DNA uptake
LGPSPLSGDNPDEDLLEKIKAIKSAVGSPRMRALVGRERKLIEEGNVYGEKYPEEKFEKLLSESIKNEYERHRILLALEDKSQSVKDLAVSLGLDPSNVLEHMLVLKGRSQVDFQEIIKNTPIFTRI